MRVVVFLAFLFQSRVCRTDRRGRVRGKGQELLKERLDVFFGLSGCLIPVGAGLNFGQDFAIIQVSYGLISKRIPTCLLFNLSIAHCSNSSSVISAVGGMP